jgi:hypothetical protein
MGARMNFIYACVIYHKNLVQNSEQIIKYRLP